MLWLKACPRCQMGDVTLDRDMYGWHILCLQCGFMKDLDNPAAAETVLRGQSQASKLVAQTA